MKKLLLCLLLLTSIANASSRLFEIDNNSDYAVSFIIKDFTWGIHISPDHGVIPAHYSQTLDINYDQQVGTDAWQYVINFSVDTKSDQNLVSFSQLTGNHWYTQDWKCEKINDNPYWHVGCYYYPNQSTKKFDVLPSLNVIYFKNR